MDHVFGKVWTTILQWLGFSGALINIPMDHAFQFVGLVHPNRFKRKNLFVCS